MTENELLAACLTEKRNMLRTNWYDFSASEIQDQLKDRFIARGYDSNMARFAALRTMQAISADYE